MTTSYLQPIKRQRLHESIAERLEEMILAGEFRPGQSLPTEAEIAAQMAVSRLVVRDAMRVLSTKGLIEIRHGVGAFVTSSGRDRLAEALALSLRRGDYTPWELFIIRRGLEAVVVQEAIAHATPAHIAQLRDSLQRMRAQLERGTYPGDLDEHTRFHQLMVQCTNNRILMDLLEPITVFRIPNEIGMGNRVMARMTYEQAEIEDYLDKHTAIVDAIERRDVAGAEAAMLKHLGDLEKRISRPKPA